jgi:2-polyprenyl-3-methyl-5-hydroxy-6-metoxy-1,4-benzoquinol methylase
MIDLSRRRDLPEVMDDPDLPPAVYVRCLTDLAAVNRWTLTHRATLAWLARATRGWAPGRPLTVLDVACGDGDLLRAIHRWATRAGLRPVLAGIDLNPGSARAAAAATPADMVIEWRTGDVFDHAPIPPPDFIVTSQFTHHLTDAQVVSFLQWLERHAGRGWFVADIQRHIIPYYGFRVLAWVMRWHRIVRLDGTASVARSFRRADWVALLARAGIADATIRWALPFRHGIGRLR